MILQPNCSELCLRLEIKDRRNVLKELKKLKITEVEFIEEDYYDSFAKGFKNKVKFLIDEDNPNLPDIEYGAHIQLEKNEGNWVISSHQHCQHQIFPTMRKIHNHFGGEIYSDGGSTDDYEEWNGNPIEPYNGWVQVIIKHGDWDEKDLEILGNAKKEMKDFKKVQKLFKLKLSRKKKDILTQICVMEKL